MYYIYCVYISLIKLQELNKHRRTVGHTSSATYLEHSIMFGEIAKSSFITILTIINSIANGGLIAILVKSRELQEDSSTPLILALNITDFVHGATFGVITLTLSWMGQTNETIPHFVKQLQFFSMRMTRLGSLNLVAALAVVKLITIVKPLRAVQLITKTKIRIMVVVSFLVPLPACLLGAFTTLQYSYVSKETSVPIENGKIRICVTTLFGISLMVYTSSYLYIFICVVKQIITMRRLVLPVDGNEQAASNPVISALKSSKGIMAVLTIYVIVYIPALTLANIYLNSEIYFVFYWLTYGFGFLNVFAYVAFSKPARKQLINFWHFIKGGNENENTGVRTVSEHIG